MPVKHRKKLYDRLWKDLLAREGRIAGRQIKCVLDLISLLRRLSSQEIKIGFKF